VSDDPKATSRDIVPGFAGLVRKLRMERDWSPYDLARIAEVGVTTVYDIEKERRSPSLMVAMKLAKALNMDVPLTAPATPKKVLHS
jgi:DNA-binding XRE family transcriptional regulator